jgi:hypothetical protein
MTIPSQLLRGGSWYDDLGECRSAYRNRHWPGNAYSDIGFRVVCFPQATTTNITLAGLQTVDGISC